MHVEYAFPFGWSELEGIAARGHYGLAAHQQASGGDLFYFDDLKRERYTLPTPRRDQQSLRDHDRVRGLNDQGATIRSRDEMSQT